MTPNAGQPNIIQGQLPFQPGGNPLAGAAGGVNGLAEQYGQSYNSALSQNQALYQNILQGYQQTAASQTSGQNAIAGGYNDLYNNVLGGIAGIGKSQSQSIADTYAQQSGALSNQLTNSGLGNTTVASQMQRGPQLDEQKAQIALQNQIAQLTAGYQSNLGMAGLNQQNMANMQNTALAGQQLGWMNSVTAAYPDAGQYNSLYSQQGQWQQAQADRDLALKLSQQGRTSVTPGPGVSGAGFSSGRPSGSTNPFGTPGQLGQGSQPGFSMGSNLSGPNGVTGPAKSWSYYNNPTPYSLQVANANYAGMGGYDMYSNNANDYGQMQDMYGSPQDLTDMGAAFGGGGGAYDLYSNNANDMAGFDQQQQEADWLAGGGNDYGWF